MPTFHYFYNSVFFAGQWHPKFELPGIDLLPDPAALLGADAVVVHLPSILAANAAEEVMKLRRVAPAHQVWVAESVESSVNYPMMDDGQFMACFDIEASYRQQADVWLPYIPDWCRNDSYRHVAAAGDKFCCAFISSSWDQSDRRAFTRELFEHLPIDSYGRFMRNKKLWRDKGVQSKLKTLKKYRFTLAFENSITKDYVTEKFFEPLQMGSIPIYLGAPNIDEFAPGENCFVNAGDFASARELAEFLKKADPAQFHAWRKAPLRPQFRDMLAKANPGWREQLSELIKLKLNAKQT